jgi:hypothetical protein
MGTIVCPFVPPSPSGLSSNDESKHPNTYPIVCDDANYEVKALDFEDPS